MARYWPEPPHHHGSISRSAILLVNLGTPAAPSAAALRPYLRAFLSDPRVIEIPRLLWLPILHGIILRLRPRASAQKYAVIWSEHGSPLLHYTASQATLLARSLGARGHGDVVVDFAMRYGQPSIAEKLQDLRRRGCNRILVLPLYPQYSATTTATVIDEVGRCLSKIRNLPELRFVRSFPTHSGYIAALANQVRAYWAQHGQGDRLVMSFHGTPQRSHKLGDPYFCECQQTGQQLAAALGLPAEQVLVTFQSRFGKAAWLQPYTQPTIEALATQGVGRIDVICPGFVSDCLETLEEIAIECRAAFLAHGGREFHYIPCLNDRSEWIEALADLAVQHLGHWLEEQDSPEHRAASRARALALGASD